MFPHMIDLSYDECSFKLRVMELETYSKVISVFRAKGALCEHKRRLLNDLAVTLNIPNERHKAEVRRAANDELLSMISYKLSGKDYVKEWYKEGRRTYPYPLRAPPETVATPLANCMGSVLYAMHSKERGGKTEDVKSLSVSLEKEADAFISGLFPVKERVQLESDEESKRSPSPDSNVRVTRSQAQRKTPRKNVKRRKRNREEEKRQRYVDVFGESDILTHKEVLPTGRVLDCSKYTSEFTTPTSLVEYIQKETPFSNVCDSPSVLPTTSRGTLNDIKVSEFVEEPTATLEEEAKSPVNSLPSTEELNGVSYYVIPASGSGDVRQSEYCYSESIPECEENMSTKTESPHPSWPNYEACNETEENCVVQDMANGFDCKPQIIRIEEGYVIISETSDSPNQLATECVSFEKGSDCLEEEIEGENGTEEMHEKEEGNSQPKEVFHFETMCSEEDINDDLRLIHEGIKTGGKAVSKPAGTTGQVNGKLNPDAYEDQPHREHCCSHSVPSSYSLAKIEHVNFHDYGVSRHVNYSNSIQADEESFR